MNRYHVWTVGCQMNKADSERLGAGLEQLGLEWTPTAKDADVLILNSCVVRQNAEDRVVGMLTSLKPWKERNPGVTLALMGCMVGPKSDELRARFPYVDVFMAPQPFEPPIRPVGAKAGSGPRELALFGYEPLRYTVGRGVVESRGIDFDLKPKDVAARGNFCTLDDEGRITDRRAGRIATELTLPLCEALREIELPGVQLFVEPVRDYRFVLVLRPKGRKRLSGEVRDTDPQKEGVTPLPPEPLAPEAKATAEVVAKFLAGAAEKLRGREPANGLMLRGFATIPELPNMPETFNLRAGAVAAYPMYRGLAKLAGMTVLATGETFDDEIETVQAHWDEFDFMFVHYKPADAAGEDGDFKAKVAAFESFDSAIPKLRALGADVLMIAGDHSTPAVLGTHSWHSVPFLLQSKWARQDEVRGFNERQCVHGSLGTFPASAVLPLAMAHTRPFAKYVA